jgi:tetratricopeptide (TPR) repeat protein
VPPVELPVPIAAPAQVAAALDADRARARRIRPELEREVALGAGGPLYELRAFGEAFRAYGRAEASRDTAAILARRSDMLAAFGRARALGDDQVVAFRALQTEMFLSAVQRWEISGAKEDDLIELGGPFLELVTRQHWVDAHRRLALTAALQSIFFRRRHCEIVGVSAPPFALSLDESRTLYAFLLTHPLVEQDKTEAQTRRSADAWRMRKLDELARIDRAYPYELGRGVLFCRMGQYEAAEKAFRAHLSLSPDGPYALRARNYLVAVLRAGQP